METAFVQKKVLSINRFSRGKQRQMNDVRAATKVRGLDEKSSAHERASVADPIEIRGQHCETLGIMEDTVQRLLFGNMRGIAGIQSRTDKTASSPCRRGNRAADQQKALPRQIQPSTRQWQVLRLKICAT
jgi:hypothetical protein